MGEHFKCLSAIFPIIMRTKDEKKQILLLRRENTGYMDGRWDFAGSGHVDENESAMQAVARECREELGIIVVLKDIHFAHLSHRVGQNVAMPGLLIFVKKVKKAIFHVGKDSPPS